MSSSNLCKICNKNDFKYTCPKCNIMYCSIACYKSNEHQKCSEKFYKRCVEDEISETGQSNEDIKNMYDILQRLNNQYEEDEFNFDTPQPELDSDDDIYEEDNDIASRMEGIDINDSNKIWDLFTDLEKKDFESQLQSGEILKLMPKYTPWWSTYNSKLVVPISKEQIPNVCDNIPLFSSIYSKEPPPCIHNNLWNVITAYASSVKFFNGEHLTNPTEATKYFLAISTNLKKNVNFDDAEQAVISIQMEALAENLALPCDEFTEIQRDSRQLMSGGINFKLAALSDTLNLFKSAKDQLFGKKSKPMPTEFNQTFESHRVSKISKSNLNLIIKKVEFLLSFVSRDLQR